MNLHRMLQARAARGTPLRVALIGAGKFGSMYLAQAKHTPGIHVVGDRGPRAGARARVARAHRLGSRSATRARSLAEAARGGTTFITDDALALIARAARSKIVIDATGNPAAGIAPRARVLRARQARRDGQRRGRRARRPAARAARARRRHRLLARVRRPAGAHLRAGRLVPRRRLRGRRRGQGHEVPARVPRSRRRTPCGRTTASRRRWSPPATSTRRCSTRSSTAPRARSRWRRSPTRRALTPAPDGLAFPPCGVDDLPRVLRPRDEGGMLAPRRPGRGDLEPRARRTAGVPRPALGRLRHVPRGRRGRRGYVRRCFREYGFSTDPSGRYAAMYKPYHAIGLELGISVASVGLARRADRRRRRAGAATSSRPRSATSRAGETLDGEGGYTVYGKLMPAAASLRAARPAARARARREARQRRRGARAGPLGRRGVRRRRSDRCAAARDGTGRAARRRVRRLRTPRPGGRRRQRDEERQPRSTTSKAPRSDRRPTVAATARAALTIAADGRRRTGRGHPRVRVHRNDVGVLPDLGGQPRAVAVHARRLLGVGQGAQAPLPLSPHARRGQRVRLPRLAARDPARPPHRRGAARRHRVARATACGSCSSHSSRCSCCCRRGSPSPPRASMRATPTGATSRSISTAGSGPRSRCSWAAARSRC